MANKSGNDDGKEPKFAFTRILSIVLAVLGAVGFAVCLGVYIAIRNDVLFIPMALFAVLAIIAFTYVRIKG